MSNKETNSEVTISGKLAFSKNSDSDEEQNAGIYVQAQKLAQLFFQNDKKKRDELDERLDKLLEIISLKRRDNINIASEFDYSKSNEQISEFILKVINLFWIKFQCDRRSKSEKIEEISEASFDFLPDNIKEFFTVEIALSNLTERIGHFIGNNLPIELIEEELDAFGDPNEAMNTFIRQYEIKKGDGFSIMNKLNFKIIEETFKKIEKKLEEKVTLRFMVYGKTGVGKTQFICMLEGYLNTISGKPITKRNISRNGRGTTDISSTEILIGNLKIIIDDTTGLGDVSENYSNEKIWEQNRKHFANSIKKDLNGNEIKGYDRILFFMPGDVCRVTNDDKEVLRSLIKEFQRIYPKDLKWWKKVSFVISKCNNINNPSDLGKYSLGKFSRERGLPKEELKEEYDRIYLKTLYFQMEKWNKEIRDRIYYLITNNDCSYKDDNVSMTALFYHFAKEFYGPNTTANLPVSKIKEYSEDLSVVLIGDAEKNDVTKEEYDYLQCSIIPLPNPYGRLSEEFIDEYEDKINDIMVNSSYLKDWFEILMNHLYSKSKSDNFRLQVLTLNEISKSEGGSKITYHESEVATHQTYVNTTKEVTDGFWASFIKFVFSIFGF
tara:strand:- start:567 stop:2390 length:1824 start_codon:yes stop_codon:yes gene_type:complete